MSVGKRMSLGKPYVSGKAACLWERSEIEHMRLIPMNVYICKNIYKKTAECRCLKTELLNYFLKKAVTMLELV